MASIVKRPGSPFWTMVFWRDGKQIWRTTKTTDEAVARRYLADVKAMLEGVSQQAAVQRLIAAVQQRPVVTQAVGVSQVWDEYARLPEAAEVAPAWLRGKRALVLAWAGWMAERHPEVVLMSEVSERMAMEYLREGLAGRSGQTRNNAQSALSSVWKQLRVPLGLPGNPWAAVPRAKAVHVRREDLTIEQVQALFAAARAAGEWWPGLVALGFYSGQRFGDCCTLEWAELVEKDGELWWRHTPSKTKASGRDVMVWLPKAEVGPLLPGRPAENAGFVWPELAAKYRGGDRLLYQQLLRLFGEAGLQSRRPTGKADGDRLRAPQVHCFHSLRHTFVTMLEAAGVGRQDVQALVGHGSPSMTEHYSHCLAAGRRIKGVLPGLGG